MKYKLKDGVSFNLITVEKKINYLKSKGDELIDEINNLKEK